MVLNVVGSSPILHPSKGVSRVLSPFFLSLGFCIFTSRSSFRRLVSGLLTSPPLQFSLLPYGWRSSRCRSNGAARSRRPATWCFAPSFLLLRLYPYPSNIGHAKNQSRLPKFFIVRWNLFSHERKPFFSWCEAFFLTITSAATPCNVLELVDNFGFLISFFFDKFIC